MEGGIKSNSQLLISQHGISNVRAGGGKERKKEKKPQPNKASHNKRKKTKKQAQKRKEKKKRHVLHLIVFSVNWVTAFLRLEYKDDDL